jgi:predicted dehydrogenase
MIAEYIAYYAPACCVALRSHAGFSSVAFLDRSPQSDKLSGMGEPARIGIISLGVMGQRMLARMTEHPRVRATIAWDPNPQVVAEVQQRYPDLRIAAAPAEVIGATGLDGLYIASPPASHLAYAHQGFDAGLAVFCEKPLTVDFAAGREAIARIETERLRAAVNFSLGSSPGLAAMTAAARDGSIGAPQRVEIELAFDQWPRSWQSAAGRWLAQRAEGGFAREVLSHFVFVLQRALGQATVEAARPDYPEDGVSSERALTARLEAGGVPAKVEARVGGSHPDFNRMTLVGSTGAVELHDWFGLRRRRGNGDWIADGTAQGNRQTGQAAQLDQLAAMIAGRAHTLPGFAEALAVQETIEAILKGR